MLVIEDVHWADEATLDVLTLLALPHHCSARARGCAAIETTNWTGTDSSASSSASSSDGPARLRIESLSPDAVAHLAQPYGIDPAELYRTTDGNPFFVLEVLAAGRRADTRDGARRGARPGGSSVRRRRDACSRRSP